MEKVAVLGVPWDGGSSFLRGAAAAPAAIRRAYASPAGNRFTETGIDLGAASWLEDLGDLELPAEAAEVVAAVESEVARVYAGGNRLISLGGDHSITYPVLKGVASILGPPEVVHVDAHPDLYDELDGDRLSHACPFARALEDGAIARLTQVGVRTATDHQRRQAERFGVEMIDMRAWRAGERPRPAGAVYLSLDLDGLDPAFAPGVSHLEPGGLSTGEVIELIQELPAPPLGADIVELNPLRDPGGVTATVAAKLLKEIAGRMAPEAA